MESRRNPLALGALALGFLIFVVSFFLAYRASTAKNESNPIASVTRETGQVSILKAGFVRKEKVEKRTPVYTLDSIETSDTGEAMVSFLSTFRVRVIEDSLVTLEKVDDSKGGHVVIILKRGDIRIDSYGRDGELFIAKNGERISAVDYESSTLKTIPLETVSATPTPNLNTQLTDEEINSVMTANRSSFFKCYTQLLQKNPQAKGEASISFTIENSGKLSVYNVTSSQLTQDDFKKCLLDVMSRISFRPFQGPQVSTLFPLKFE